MPFLKTCCCGCSLKDGTLIVGYIAFIGSILLLAAALFGYPEEKPEEEKLGVIASSCVQVILSALLIFGTTKGYRWLVLPWIVLSILGTILSAILVILVVYQLYGIDNGNGAIVIIVAVAISLPLFGLQSYLLLVVISHYQELKLAAIEGENNVLPIYSTPNHVSSNGVGVTT